MLSKDIIPSIIHTVPLLMLTRANRVSTNHLGVGHNIDWRGTSISLKLECFSNFDAYLII
jgi:hypothetical protein